jgi:MFS family permease
MRNQDASEQKPYGGGAASLGMVPGQVAAGAKWYEGITAYMWLVLLIGSLGWVFDIFEGQIFVASMKEAMPALLPAGTLAGSVDFYNNIAMAGFLVGGALGGVLFGMLSDRIGRTTTMILTILMYSLFTCVTAFSQTWWQMVILRFLVALGTGGEWAVASAMIAEVFPKRARARSLGIFHASSVIGTYLAVLAGAFVVGNPALGENAWRWAFVIGAVPAVLTLWIRWKLHEPEQWVEARQRSRSDTTQRAGRIADLFAPGLRKNTLLGLILATVGLATFWGVHVYGRDLLRTIVERSYLAEAAAAGSTASAKEILSSLSGPIKRWEMLGMFLVTTGGGLGLLSFGPLCERLGRRATFFLFQAGGLASALVVFQGMAHASAGALCWMLPVFGFMTLGLHAGYAIYFPELFPTRLRGTGGGFCFNGGRFLAASILIVRGWMRSEQGLGLSLESTASLLSLLLLVGILILPAAPETKGRELPE